MDHKQLHDTYRVNKGGAGSFDQVMQGWEVLLETRRGCQYPLHGARRQRGPPLEIYHFFRDELKAEYMQFIPIVERATAETLPLANQGWSERPAATARSTRRAASWSPSARCRPEQYGRFLIAIFDEWVRRDVGKVFVQSFDAALANWVGQPSLCIFQPTCGNALALEHNGDLYSCDHFVEPAYLLGNIQETHMIELVASEQQRKFGQDKLDSLPKYCRAMRGALRLLRRMPAQPFHPDAGWRAGIELSVRRIQAILQPHQPPDAPDGRSAAPRALRRRGDEYPGDGRNAENEAGDCPGAAQ